ncbi:aconitate hydratase AcnA [Liquorilactobacillus nagelii]|uniref:aconitate hydratase AcnA n=1 Tax=Liquorilactobacillus nagelii TaxID=82688 RepID=UPI0006F150AF|nr:aconitate hydratase AcnA [Liquorilactobacillus nagelii]KRL42335.1 aconitate hydratase [Liquorilactobacillus nagelii DSM 13675]QYH53365.1 aconitate hydratase AcnA [Liquorilactobacillus nagelii DSM 13675]
MTDTFRKEFTLAGQQYYYYDIAAYLSSIAVQIETLPYSIRVLLELTLRQSFKKPALRKYLTVFRAWDEHHSNDIPYKPERVILQDFTGVPALVDLAAMREEVQKRGGDPTVINPDVPVHLVIDHSVQVDMAGNEAALEYNIKQEFKRNQERYSFLKWAQASFENLTVIPPDTGIIHQVNLEYLSPVVRQSEAAKPLVFPDTLVGTDSHTTMINALGVLGWGVGGIEAEASMLGQESYFPMPEVVGVYLIGQLPATATATDLALTLTHLLRERKVVGKFVEFYGPGLKALPLANRATIANMAPEYGATCGYFPIDQRTIEYLRLTDRSEDQIKLVEKYAKINHLWYQENEDQNKHYSEMVELDLRTVTSSVAGPKRPQDLVELSKLPRNFKKYTQLSDCKVESAGQSFNLQPGSLGIAAITSCTNTSNPEILITAGLLAKNAVAAGLSVPAYVKTSFAPGSRVVAAYLQAADLQDALNQLGFNIVGYGCTTCIGNSGKLQPGVQEIVSQTNYPLAAIESGNRNFEGRVNPLIKDTYLASPPLVIAYALAGTLNIDLLHQPLGKNQQGQDVFLSDLWPSASEISEVIHQYVKPRLFSKNYQNIFSQNAAWNALPITKSVTYPWNEKSTYLASPPLFHQRTANLVNLRLLAKLGDSITTDHISPAGFIGQTTPAGKYLQAQGVRIEDFNSYGSRRGNHEVMMRGTLANIRLQNQLTPKLQGGYTKSWLTGKETTIYEAAMDYQRDGIGTIILAGKDYGMGSSRDWAAKGVELLGVRAVIAESFERIHRSNLVMMGVLPLQFLTGDTAEKLGLIGNETFKIVLNGKTANVSASSPEHQINFTAQVRFDAPIDAEYFKASGILPYVISEKMK